MAQNPAPEPEQLLTPSEVAAMFRVNPKTVTRWARAGKISAIRTLGGHRRFRASRRSASSSSRSTSPPSSEPTLRRRATPVRVSRTQRASQSGVDGPRLWRVAP